MDKNQITKHEIKMRTTKKRGVTPTRLILRLSGTTSGSNSSFGLFYSIYLSPEIKETPYYGREEFSLSGAEARLQPFCSSHKALASRPKS